MWNISKYRISVNWKVICFGTSRKKNVGITYKMAYDGSIPPSLCHFANEGIKWFILTLPNNIEKITIIWKRVNISNRQLGPFGIDPLHFSALIFGFLLLFVLYLLLPRGFRVRHFCAYPKRYAWSARSRARRNGQRQHASIFPTCYFRRLGMVAKTRTVWPLM